jgi:hypothetical protein
MKLALFSHNVDIDIYHSMATVLRADCAVSSVHVL